MKYSPAIVDGELLYYEIRNDEGMYIGSAIKNQAPFNGCDPVTLKDAEKNARLWAAAPDLLNALEEALPGIEELNGEFQEGWDSVIDKIEAAIKKAKL